jgi:hypothetical protein
MHFSSGSSCLPICRANVRNLLGLLRSKGYDFIVRTIRGLTVLTQIVPTPSSQGLFRWTHILARETKTSSPHLATSTYEATRQ